ncbi:DUF4232 domain-containing protein [Streptomyces sp. NPDC001941]|uniref:DUF4232 domain-containing protein n=1 Tax=Streptomyces sp. NPDC001941 TaxID=3154659 RepID=UPI003326DC17
MHAPVHGNRTRRAHRTGLKTVLKPYVLGAAVAAALLTSTACQPGGDKDTGASGTPGSPKATDSALPGGAPSTSASPSTKVPLPPTESTGKSGDGGKGGTAVPACTMEELAVSAQKEPADSKDARHLLITVQNVGDRTCDVYHYPFVKIGDAKRTTPVIQGSSPDPGKPMRLGRAEEAYAALLVAGGKMDEYPATSVTLTLSGRKVGTKVGKSVDVPLPVQTLYGDDGQLVTFWTTASGGALDFIMSK